MVNSPVVTAAAVPRGPDILRVFEGEKVSSPNGELAGRGENGMGFGYVWNQNTILQYMGRLYKIGQKESVEWYLTYPSCSLKPSIMTMI